MHCRAVRCDQAVPGCSMRAFCVGFGWQESCGRSSVLSTLLQPVLLFSKQSVCVLDRVWTGKQCAAAESWPSFGSCGQECGTEPKYMPIAGDS